MQSFYMMINFLTEFRGANWKKQIIKHEGAPADTGEHTTVTLAAYRYYSGLSHFIQQWSSG